MATLNGKKGVYVYSSMEGAALHIFNTKARAAGHFARMCDKVWGADTATIDGGSEAVAKVLAKDGRVTGMFTDPAGNKHYRKVEFMWIIDAPY